MWLWDDPRLINCIPIIGDAWRSLMQNRHIYVEYHAYIYVTIS